MVKIISKIKCACGCGELIPSTDNKNRPRKYVVGHVNNIRVYNSLTQEIKDKMSIVKKEQYKSGLVPWNKGIPCSSYTKKLIAKANTGRIVSDDTRKKLSIAKGGKNAYNWKGGVYNDKYGYVWIKPDNKDLLTYHGKYAKRCNVIWFEKTGEIIRPPYLLHHKNGMKQDDRFENLHKTTRAKHIELHKDDKGFVVSIPRH